MATLPKVKRILKEDLREAPSWVDRVIVILNLFMDGVYNALNKNLSFGENVKGQFKTYEFMAGASPELNAFNFMATIMNPSGILLLKIEQIATTNIILVNPVSIPSWHYDGVNVYVDSITGLNAGTRYRITILVI